MNTLESSLHTRRNGMKCFVVICVSLFLFKCGHDNRQTYLLKTHESEILSGICKNVNVDGTEVFVIYRPTNVMVDNEVGDSNIYDPIIDSLYKKYSLYHYFLLRISKDDKEVLSQIGEHSKYQELVQTISFRIAPFVSLTTSEGDTIPVAGAVVNRTYGLGVSTDLLIAFERVGLSNSESMDFNIDEFGLGIGRQRFRFFMKHIQHAYSSPTAVIRKEKNIVTQI